ncbi:MAG: hypothetical protein D6731_15900 [Planctomycetota bacterium]|nr:MAG: hypothetical protein D6731_15900 [Planctomycetota bacterium]
MPELTHTCGKTVRFPSGTEGKRGRCPHCGEGLRVPGGDEVPAQRRIRLEPPPHWKAYEDYLHDRGPPPRPLVIPKNLMLKEEADEKWAREAERVPSRWYCPACKERMFIDQVVCTKCGLDFRTGHVIGKNAKLSAKGMAYLEEIPWLREARKALAKERKAEGRSRATAKLRAKAPRRRRRR